jgi:carbonic anhydrase/acetyltransferase-like protein (isoleucine patch superfamily)
VLVSANAVVLRGADVGDNAVLAAGAIVGAGEHRGGWLHAGAPARPVRPLA